MADAIRGTCRVTWTQTTLTGSASLSTSITYDPDNAATDGTWEMNAGSSITFYFTGHDGGALRVGAANNVTIQVRSDDGATVIRTFHSGARPGNSTSYEFFSTSDGTSSGSPRCGTYRLYLRMVRDTGLEQYDVDSDGIAVVGTINTFNKGGLRGNMLVQSITSSDYPDEEIPWFAFGTTNNDEIMTMTAAHTQRAEDTGSNQTVRFISFRTSDSVVAETGPTIEVGSTTTTSQNFVCDVSYYKLGAPEPDTFGCKFEVVGNANLVFANSPTSELWTLPIDDGADLVQDGTTAVKDTNVFDCDPRCNMIDATADRSLYQRGETITYSFSVENSRDELLTRTLTWFLSGDAAAFGGGWVAPSDTGPIYNGVHVIAPNDDAYWNLTGNSWIAELITPTDIAPPPHLVDSIFCNVSRMWQLSKSSSSIDNGIKVGSAPGLDDITTAQKGDTVYFSAYVYNARGELLSNELVNFNVRRIGSVSPGNSTPWDESDATDNLTSGLFSNSYTVDLDEVSGTKTLVVSDEETGIVVLTNQPRFFASTGLGNFAESSVSPAEWSVDTAAALLPSKSNLQATSKCLWSARTNLRGVCSLRGDAEITTGGGVTVKDGQAHLRVVSRVTATAIVLQATSLGALRAVCSLSASGGIIKGSPVSLRGHCRLSPNFTDINQQHFRRRATIHRRAKSYYRSSR